MTAMALLSIGGCMGGFLLARSNVQEMLFHQLTRDALQSGDVIGSFLEESRLLLSVLNQSKFAYCSEDEVDSFRQLVFHSQNLRDVGRMRDGKFACSALFGRKHFPDATYKADMTQLDGTRMYRNIPPYLSDKAMVFVLQKGDSFVVEDPNYDSHIQQTGPNTETTMVDIASQRKGRPSGKPSAIPGAVKDRDWQGNLGDTLYVTRCMPSDFICTSAYGSLSTAMWTQRAPVISFTALGGLLGMVLALVAVLIQLHNRSMTRQLRRAIQRGKVSLVYQPILDFSQGRIVGAEALARWNDEDGYPVSPEVFVRLAEERGFVGELTRHVTQLALRDFGEILRESEPFCLNVNITATDLDDATFLPMLESSLEAAGVAPQRLAIELTESSTARKQVAVDAISQLRKRGHSVQIDDFGTGYSSLAYLKDLSVDAIKIDKAFTQAIGTEAAIGAILPQILAMAEALNLLVIVEGIETPEQADYFSEVKMPVLMQGWFFGRPVPAEEFKRKLASERENSKQLTSVA